MSKLKLIITKSRSHKLKFIDLNNEQIFLIGIKSNPLRKNKPVPFTFLKIKAKTCLIKCNVDVFGDQLKKRLISKLIKEHKKIKGDLTLKL